MTTLITAAASGFIGGSIFEQAISVMRDNSTSFINLVIVLIVFGTEAIFENTIFRCPCKHPQNTAYGILFIAAPATALLVVGILANNTTWQLVTGCWRRSPESKHGFRKSSYFCCGVMARALVAPVAWIFCAFLDGKYYECARSEDPCSEDPVIKQANKELVARSQIIGWSWLIGLFCLALIGLLWWRSCNRLTHQQDKYMSIYRKMERLEMERQFEEHAQATAKENVTQFLDREVRSKRDWDEISKVPLLTPRYEGNKEPVFTPLHKFVVRESNYGPPKHIETTSGIAMETQTSLDGRPGFPYIDTVSSSNERHATTSLLYAESKA